MIGGEDILQEGENAESVGIYIIKNKKGRLRGAMKKALEVKAVGTRKGSDGWDKMKT